MTVLEMRAARSLRASVGSYTATVTGTDGVLFVAASSSASALEASIADYVRARCDDVLWPADAAEVRALFAAGDVDAAIAWYFAHVGARWDDERLELGRDA